MRSSSKYSPIVMPVVLAVGSLLVSCALAVSLCPAAAFAVAKNQENVALGTRAATVALQATDVDLSEACSEGHLDFVYEGGVRNQYFVDEGQTMALPTITLELWDSATESYIAIPADQYTIEVYKPVESPSEYSAWERTDGPLGTGVYGVVAKAVEGKGLTGETRSPEGNVDPEVFYVKTYTDISGAVVTFADSWNNRDGDAVLAGEAPVPVVTIGDRTVPTSAYICRWWRLEYLESEHFEKLDAAPTTIGEYIYSISAIEGSGYHGSTFGGLFVESSRPNENETVIPSGDEKDADTSNAGDGNPVLTPDLTVQAPVVGTADLPVGLAISESAIVGSGEQAAKVKATSASEVAYTAPAKKSAKKVTVPATVKVNDKTYKVTSIAANALKGSKATTLTVGKNVKKVGKGALKGAKKLKVLDIKTSGLDKKSFDNLLKGSKVKTVKLEGISKKAKKSYRKWAKSYGVTVK